MEIDAIDSGSYGDYSVLEDIETSQVIRDERFTKVALDYLSVHLDAMSIALKNTTSQKKYYVGELHEAWKFPSDHLPVGATVDNFHLLTWNTLNSKFIDWIEKDTQGLNRSLILDEHYQIINDSGLTLREEHTVQNILSMIEHPTHPRSILSLQECGQGMLHELQSRLPAHMKVVYSSEIPVVDQNIIIYDSNQFTMIQGESKIVTDAFPCNPGRPLMDIVFLSTNTNKKYRIINTHAPGDPNLPGRFELAKYVANSKREDLVTLVMGDMNFDYNQMKDAFSRVNMGSFSCVSNDYPTIVGTDKCAKSLDHIFVHFGEFEENYRVNRPEQVLDGLRDVVSAISPPNYQKQTRR